VSGVSSYNVVTTGGVQNGFEREQVQAAFAALFKVPQEKAAGLLARERVVKRDLDRPTAERVKARLETIGLVVSLQEQLPAGGFGDALSMLDAPADTTTPVPPLTTSPVEPPPPSDAGGHLSFLETPSFDPEPPQDAPLCVTSESARLAAPADPVSTAATPPSPTGAESATSPAFGGLSLALEASEPVALATPAPAAPSAPAPGLGLALEGTEPVASTPAVVPPAPAVGGLGLSLDGGSPPPAPAPLAKAPGPRAQAKPCPKCEEPIPPEAEQCPACGVYPHKVKVEEARPDEREGGYERFHNHTSEDAEGEEQQSDVDGRAAYPEFNEPFGPKTFAVGIAVALGGALVWMLVAVLFNYELGLIAWMIGAAIGGAVAYMGGHGTFAGMNCAALALAAILGGKFMAYSHIQAEIIEDMLADTASLQARYETTKENIVAYAELEDEEREDDDALLSFIYDRGISEPTDSPALARADLIMFRYAIGPYFDRYAPGGDELTYDIWFTDWVQSEIDEMHPRDLILRNLSFIDFVFMFLGVGTAWRLGRGG